MYNLPCLLIKLLSSELEYFLTNALHRARAIGDAYNFELLGKEILPY
jgi:hypothetical protein